MTARLALAFLGLDWTYVVEARADLLAAIARANNDLIHSFSKGAHP